MARPSNVVILKDLQEQFVEALVLPDNISAIIKEIAPHPRLTAHQRFNIYRNSIIERSVKVLKATYPICFALVGESCFKGVCFAYIKQYPNIPNDIDFYGEKFATFLATFIPLQDLVYLSEVAKLEWAVHCVLLGGMGNKLDIHQLALVSSTSQSDLRFKLCHKNTLLHSDYPIFQIWQMHQPEYKGSETIQLDEGGCHLIIYRQGWQLCIAVLSEEEFILLSYFNEGETFEAICEKCDSNHPQLDFSAVFSKIVEQGWLSGFYF